MNTFLPSEHEDSLFSSRVLYLGTTYYVDKTKKEPVNENAKINLKLLQDSLAARYPVNEEKYAKGIETNLAIYPSGIQMKHSSGGDSAGDCIIFYPMKSLVYCGALRLTFSSKKSDTETNWKFAPLDSEAAEETRNLRNPPVFVTVFKGVEPSSTGDVIECNVFVVGMKKSAMRLVESCQRAYNTCTQATKEFRDIYGSIPAIFTKANDFNNSLAVVRKHDRTGFFYVINESTIDLWQLYETIDSSSENSKYKLDRETRKLIKEIERDQEVKHRKIIETEDIYATRQELNGINDGLYSSKKGELDDVYTTRKGLEEVYITRNGLDDIYTNRKELNDVYTSRKGLEDDIYKKIIDPYEDAPNLVKVEKRIDPETGQNIYVRWFAPETPPPPLAIRSSSPELPIIVRETESPQPIIVEKIVQKKKPQLIIKEIHVTEPTPPVVELVEEVDADTDSSIIQPPPPSKQIIYDKHNRHRVRNHYPPKYANFYDYRTRYPYDYYNNNREYYNFANPYYLNYRKDYRNYLYNRPQPKHYDYVYYDTYNDKSMYHRHQQPLNRHIYGHNLFHTPSRTLFRQPSKPHIPSGYNIRGALERAHPRHHHKYRHHRYHHHHHHPPHSDINSHHSSRKYDGRYNNTYEFIEDIENIINSVKTDKSRSKDSNEHQHSAKKIYVIHDDISGSSRKERDETRGGVGGGGHGKKHSRKIIVVDEEEASDEVINQKVNQHQHQQQKTNNISTNTNNEQLSKPKESLPIYNINNTNPNNNYNYNATNNQNINSNYNNNNNILGTSYNYPNSATINNTDTTNYAFQKVINPYTSTTTATNGYHLATATNNNTNGYLANGLATTTPLYEQTKNAYYSANFKH